MYRNRALRAKPLRIGLTLYGGKWRSVVHVTDQLVPPTLYTSRSFGLNEPNCRDATFPVPWNLGARVN